MVGCEADHNNCTLALRGGYGYHTVKWGQNSRFVPICAFCPIRIVFNFLFFLHGFYTVLLAVYTIQISKNLSRGRLCQ